MLFMFELVTGLVLLRQPGRDDVSVGGTCFAFRHRNVLLTAAHCVPEGQDVFVWMNTPERRTPTRADVCLHPSADLAVLRVPALDEDETVANYVLNLGPAEMRLYGDFQSFGYPVEGPSDLRAVGQQPTARLFKGHFQRYFVHESHTDGLKYWAGEMSIPAPAGLSGGPVCWPGDPPQLCGLVTTNLETYAILDSVEEVNS